MKSKWPHIVVIRENKYARVLSRFRGSSYEVQERVGNKWETLTEFHGGRGRDGKGTAIHTYNRLTAHNKLTKAKQIVLRARLKKEIRSK